MRKSLTQQHLVRLLLDDLKPSEKTALLNVVHSDWALGESYKEMKRAYLQLPKLVFKPTKSSLNNILNYSKAAMVEA